MSKARASQRKLVITAVVISLFLAMILDLITPDIYTMEYFREHGEIQLLTFGILGIASAFLIAFYINTRRLKRK